MSPKEFTDKAFKNRFLSIYGKDIKSESPLLQLKSNIWTNILLNIPPSEVVKLSEVNTKMKMLVENGDHWMETAHRAKLHIPGIRKKSRRNLLTSPYRSLIKQHIGKICDYCFIGKRYISQKVGAQGILPVNLHTNPNVVNHLCIKCRQKYFEQYPEPAIDPFLMEKILNGKELLELRDYYCLTKNDIKELRNWLDTNGIRNITHGLLQLEARRLFGGEVGIEAQQRFKEPKETIKELNSIL